jgi:hypothetical protein
MTRSVGDSPQDALRWLGATDTPWLLFFDSADDPKINLNQFFPKCTHGNIVITSRNPALRVHAGSSQLVSDMEEEDAVELLLKSAQQDVTSTNKDIAAEIVKVGSSVIYSWHKSNHFVGVVLSSPSNHSSRCIHCKV